jgi:hypothetical protein
MGKQYTNTTDRPQVYYDLVGSKHTLEPGESFTDPYVENTFERLFGSANLVSDSFTFVHGLGISSPIVVVYDGTGRQIIPDEIEVVDQNTVRIHLGSFVPITGAWRARVIGPR